MRMTGSQMDQEIAGVVALRAATANDLDTPPTQELPVELADAPSGLSRARRRYVALAAAVRDHELRSSHPAVPSGPRTTLSTPL